MIDLEPSIIRVVLLVAAALIQCSLAAGSLQEPAASKYLYPAKDVDPAVLKSDGRVVVAEAAEFWSFVPAQDAKPTAILFFPGGGVDPMAYAPLARAAAAEGASVYLVRLPAALNTPDRHRQTAIAQGRLVMNAATDIERWVVAGHSMGGSIAARFVHEDPKKFAGLILIGTTHPRDFDLSGFTGPVTKVDATEDGVARPAQSEANKRLLPPTTKWVRVEGGNHAQFGSYGAQLRDGKATISREEQQQLTCAVMVEIVRQVDAPPK